MFRIKEEFGDCDVLITSDSHFDHYNIIGYTNRKDETGELFKSSWHMDKFLIDKWNATVKPGNLVIHLGDFSFRSDRYRDKLNGKILLARGNHDKRRYDYLFDKVVDSLELKIGEFNCYLTHQPIELDRHYKKGFVPDFSLLDKYDYIICGHCHNAFKTSGKNINVGVDVWNYSPISINDLAIFLRSLKT